MGQGLGWMLAWKGVSSPPSLSGGLTVPVLPAGMVASHGSNCGNKPEKVVLGLRPACARSGADHSPAGHRAMVPLLRTGPEGLASFLTTFAGLSG